GHEGKTQCPRFASVHWTLSQPREALTSQPEIHRISTALGGDLRGSLYSQSTGNAVLTCYYYLKHCSATGGFPEPLQAGPFPDARKTGPAHSRSATKTRHDSPTRSPAHAYFQEPLK